MVEGYLPVKIPYKECLKRPYRKIMERVTGEDFPEYTSWLLNDTYNDFWKNQENANAAEKLTVPTLFTDGW